jgi:hypothetical protein
MQDWTSINAQPDQANIICCGRVFLKSARGRKTDQQHKKKNRPGQVQLWDPLLNLSAKTFQYISLSIVNSKNLKFTNKWQQLHCHTCLFWELRALLGDIWSNKLKAKIAQFVFVSICFQHVSANPLSLVYILTISILTPSTNLVTHPFFLPSFVRPIFTHKDR